MEDDKNITTVRLSEKALEIKRKLAPVFGMKNIVSAGLILLDRLSADQQKAVIAEANGGEPIRIPILCWHQPWNACRSMNGCWTRIKSLVVGPWRLTGVRISQPNLRRPPLFRQRY